MGKSKRAKDAKLEESVEAQPGVATAKPPSGHSSRRSEPEPGGTPLAGQARRGLPAAVPGGFAQAQPGGISAAGLSAAPTGQLEEATAALMQLDPQRIKPTKYNPRDIDEKAPSFLELVASVKGSGVQVPVAARPHPREGDNYELLYGERRLLISVRPWRR